MKLSQLEALVTELRACAKANNVDNPEVIFWESNRAALTKALSANPVFLNLDIDPSVFNAPVKDHACVFESEEQNTKRGDYHLPIRVVPLPVA